MPFLFWLPYIIVSGMLELAAPAKRAHAREDRKDEIGG